jgi:hypothetical protein
MRRRRWRTGLWANAGAANGEYAILTWDLSSDDPDGLEAYKVLRSMTEEEIAQEDAENIRITVKAARRMATEQLIAEAGLSPSEAIAPELRVRIREARARAAAAARAAGERAAEDAAGGPRFKFVAFVFPGTGELTVGGLEEDHGYTFQVIAVGRDKSLSSTATSASPVATSMDWFDGSRGWLGVITALLCASVISFIFMARRGIDLKIRKIAGLDAVHEAVGRATEMGRPILFIPGIQDMNEIQTIAGLTILSRVAKTAAEYDARIEVPTTRSLVMTAARETVQASYLSVGRPDAYNQDLIYYVTDEQFGYVAYVSGHMVREKPAACFYMGAFFAESLILAETGNSIGAIQVAGTAMPAQLPFFVAACDYTLIGEEFFAASAYLSGEPEQLGSLKGQDVGKVIVAVIVVIGVAAATLAAMTGSETIQHWVDLLRTTVLT